MNDSQWNYLGLSHNPFSDPFLIRSRSSSLVLTANRCLRRFANLVPGLDQFWRLPVHMVWVKPASFERCLRHLKQESLRLGLMDRWCRGLAMC